MSDWPEYETRKRVRAKQIVWFETNEDAQRYAAVIRSDGDEKETFIPNEPGMLARVEVGDYAITYPDGFKSVNTAANFEATAILVEPDDPQVMPKPERIWCAVRNSDAHIDRDTLHAKVTTQVCAFTNERAANEWAAAQTTVWSIVAVDLDPPIEVG